MIRGAFLLVAMFVSGAATSRMTEPVPFPLSLAVNVLAGAAVAWLAYDLWCREVIRWFNAGVRAGRGVHEIREDRR